MEINIPDTYLKADNTKQNMVCEILDEGVEKEFENRDGTKKTVYNFKVRTDDGRELSYTPNKTSLVELKKAFGSDTVNWVNRCFRIHHIKMPIQGQLKTVIVADPSADLTKESKVQEEGLE